MQVQQRGRTAPRPLCLRAHTHIHPGERTPIIRTTIIAHTVFGDVYTAKSSFPKEIERTPFGSRVGDSGDYYNYGEQGADLLGEFAGRACYQSWEMPNPKTATNKGYMGNIIAQGHFSVLEHASMTLYVEGVSRALTHELVRHRHLSYSELSQRYVDMTEFETVTPPAMRDTPGLAGEIMRDQVEAITDKTKVRYERLVEDLVYRGFKRKEAREAARCVLPGGMETKIVVTGNIRAWRDMLHKRWHVAADAEIREFAGKVLEHLREVAPNSVQDIPDTPFTGREISPETVENIAADEALVEAFRVGWDKGQKGGRVKSGLAHIAATLRGRRK